MFQTKTLYQTTKGFWGGGFMFLWPTITKNNTVNVDTKTAAAVLPVLATADGIFETGRYEECYNVLVNSKVIKK